MPLNGFAAFFSSSFCLLSQTEKDTKMLRPSVVSLVVFSKRNYHSGEKKKFQTSKNLVEQM